MPWPAALAITARVQHWLWGSGLKCSTAGSITTMKRPTMQKNIDIIYQNIVV